MTCKDYGKVRILNRAASNLGGLVLILVRLNPPPFFPNAAATTVSLLEENLG